MDGFASRTEVHRDLSQTFREFGVWKLLPKAQAGLGLMCKRTIDSLIEKVESMLANPEHPWRQRH